MVQNYTVWVEKKAYPVVVSDEREALLAAKAAGRVFVGLIYTDGENEAQAVNRQTCESEKALQQNYGMPSTSLPRMPSVRNI